MTVLLTAISSSCILGNMHECCVYTSRMAQKEGEMSVKFALLLSLAMVLLGCGNSEDSVQVTEFSKIGTFDSRCVALAYYRTGETQTEFDAIRAEFSEAEASGDSARMEELTAIGSGRQAEIDAQVFSTGDIDDIVAEMQSDFPAIAEQAGVEVIVSVWDLAYISEEAELVDVTDQVVALLNPSEETLGIIEAMRVVPPDPE